MLLERDEVPFQSLQPTLEKLAVVNRASLVLWVNDPPGLAWVTTLPSAGRIAALRRAASGTKIGSSMHLKGGLPTIFNHHRAMTSPS